MFEFAKAMRKILPFIWELYIAYKKFERETNEREIRGNPDDAWDERFGNGVPKDGVDNPADSGDDKPK